MASHKVYVCVCVRVRVHACVCVCMRDKERIYVCLQKYKNANTDSGLYELKSVALEC